jgi:hypothetical protein
VSCFPRPVTSIHQIEVTTHCNLRCVYCPSRHLEKHRGQPKQHMDIEVFERALEWCQHFQAKGTQIELSITGIGETLMHPEWKTLIRLAREALPENFLNFSTNGLLLDEDACKYLAEHHIEVFISLHRPEKAGPAIQVAKKYGIVNTYNAGAMLSAFDWAGQVDWYVSANPYPCDWLARGWANILVDGRITACCMDAAGTGVVAHIDDPVGFAEIAPFGLCDSCHLTVPTPEEIV